MMPTIVLALLMWLAQPAPEPDPYNAFEAPPALDGDVRVPLCEGRNRTSCAQPCASSGRPRSAHERCPYE